MRLAALILVETGAAIAVTNKHHHRRLRWCDGAWGSAHKVLGTVASTHVGKKQQTVTSQPAPVTLSLENNRGTSLGAQYIIL